MAWVPSGLACMFTNEQWNLLVAGSACRPRLAAEQVFRE
jgi:hypothetical protein